MSMLSCFTVPVLALSSLKEFRFHGMVKAVNCFEILERFTLLYVLCTLLLCFSYDIMQTYLPPLIIAGHFRLSLKISLQITVWLLHVDALVSYWNIHFIMLRILTFSRKNTEMKTLLREYGKHSLMKCFYRLYLEL